MYYQLCNICNKPLFNKHNLRIRLSKIFKYSSISIVVGSAIGAAVLPILGFRFAGVMARSLAAAFQTAYTVAGSLFAILQSLGATGNGILLFGAIGGIVFGFNGLVLSAKYFDTTDWCYGHKD